MGRQRSLLLSLFLTLPVLLFVIHHYISHNPELTPTGFTNNENVLYMSYAHQYLDQDKAALFYSNPFDGDPQSPKIYFQPVNFLFAAFLKAGADPGLVFTLFGLIMAFCCIYLGVRIIRHLLPDNKHQILITMLFTWGGGLTALAGIGSAMISGTALTHWTDGIYLADPANGWWGMNWGRTLFIPLEAYYHFLFLVIIYLLLKQKWKAAAAVALFLSLSHPFTGIEYLSIILGWILLEKIVFKNKNIPYWYLAATTMTFLFHAWYYLMYLNNFPEHQQLFSQYSAGWTYSFKIFIPAYLFVFFLSALTLYINRSVPKFLSLPHQRLFLCWAVIAFLLSKHEWFIKPMQPIHFTRGYIWAGLFLLGLPGLIWLLKYCRGNFTRKFLLILFIVFFLADNTLWIGNHLRGKETGEWEGYLKKDTREVFSFLNKTTSPSDLLIGHSGLINYMANVYTPANAWVSHPYNTPHRTERIDIMNNFLKTASTPAEWANRRLLIVINKQQPNVEINPLLKKNKLFENSSYIIFTP